MNAGSPLPWGSYPAPLLYDATPPSSPRPSPVPTAPPMQPLMYGYAPRYPTPAPRARTSHGVHLALAALALLTLASAALAAVAYRRAPKSYVVFVNGTDAAVDLVVDGKARGALAPRASVALDVAPGAHVVAAGAEQGAFDVPAPGAGKKAFRALYNIGAHAGLAVVTKYYAVARAPYDDVVDLVPEGTSFKPLPDAMPESALAVDRAFPEAITVPKGTEVTTITRICHVTPRPAPAPAGEATLGCAGY